MSCSKLFLLVLCLGVYVGICMSWVEDVAEPDTEFLPEGLHAKEAIGSDEIIRMATDKLINYDIKNDVKGRMDCGGKDDIAFGVYDETKDELSEAYMSAKNSMSEEAKAKYEAAKEKASEATGNLGAKMRNTP